MGIPVNLLEAWEPYKAARIALGNTLQPGNIQSLVHAPSNYSYCMFDWFLCNFFIPVQLGKKVHGKSR